MSRTSTNIGAPVEPLPGIIGSGRAMMEVYRVTRQVGAVAHRYCCSAKRGPAKS